MARHLVGAGHEVTVWNRTPGRAVVEGAAVAASLSELSNLDLVALCVGRSEDVLDVIEALSPHPGTLVVDHSTISPTVAASLHERLPRFLDAPITGGSMGAQNGTLTIFCGGKVEDFQEAEPILAAYGRRVAHVGPGGSGQTMKAANQIAVVGALLGLCESLGFAERAGLDLALTRELLAGGAAGSWAFENYGPKVLRRDWTPGFSIDNQLKDLGYCEEMASGLDLDVPMTELADRLLRTLQAEGRGAETTAALFDLYARGRG